MNGLCDVFLLGCERSGSTWLANVFDSHPEVELVMEPFTDEVAFFRGFPARNRYLAQGDAALVGEVRRGYARLPSIKYPLLYKRGRAPWLRAVEARILCRHDRAKRRLGLEGGEGWLAYQRLHLHAEQTPGRLVTRKTEVPSCIVTKELRLNFKVPFLAAAFPSARFLVPIRHPGAQISSIQTLFERRRLIELRASLASFLECVRRQGRFAKFRRITERVSPEMLLPVWWIVTYDVLLEDIRGLGLPLLVVTHEELSSAPMEKIASILHFCDLEPVEALRRYMAWSTTTPRRSDSPLDTSRESASDCRAAIGAVDPALNAGIAELIECLSRREGVDPAIEAYAKQLASETETAR